MSAVATTRTTTAWERYAWIAGIVFVVALLAESVVATGIALTQNDSAAGVMFFLQGFGLDGIIATFGLVLDLIAFVLFLFFVLASSVILLRRLDDGQPRPLL